MRERESTQHRHHLMTSLPGFPFPPPPPPPPNMPSAPPSLPPLPPGPPSIAFREPQQSAMAPPPSEESLAPIAPAPHPRARQRALAVRMHCHPLQPAADACPSPQRTRDRPVAPPPGVFESLVSRSTQTPHRRRATRPSAGRGAGGAERPPERRADPAPWASPRVPAASAPRRRSPLGDYSSLKVLGSVFVFVDLPTNTSPFWTLTPRQRLDNRAGRGRLGPGSSSQGAPQHAVARQGWRRRARRRAHREHALSLAGQEGRRQLAMDGEALPEFRRGRRVRG